MNIEQVKEAIEKFDNARNEPYGFYIGYRPFDNALSQKWGKLHELNDILENIEKQDNCIERNLPIERLIIYGKTQCFVLSLNPLWNGVDYDSEQSHVVTVVPYIARDGWFGNEIVSERERL